MRLLVSLLAVALPSNNSGHIVHVHVPMSPNSITCLITGQVMSEYGRAVPTAHITELQLSACSGS